MEILWKGAFPHFYTRILGKISVFYAGESANDNLIEEDWRTEINDFFKSISKQCGNNFQMDTKLVRDSFCEYFNTTNKVLWSEKFIWIYVGQSLFLEYILLIIYQFYSNLNNYRRGWTPIYREKTSISSN